jgi:hypothetical protein
MEGIDNVGTFVVTRQRRKHTAWQQMDTLAALCSIVNPENPALQSLFSSF